MADTAPLESFFLAYASAEDALEAAIEQAKAIIRNGAVPIADQLSAIGLKRDLEEQHRLLVSAHETFMNTFTAVNPPSAEVLARGTKLAKDLAALVADNILLEGKLNAVIGIVSALGTLTTPPAAAATQAAHADLVGLQMQRTFSARLQQLRAHVARQ